MDVVRETSVAPTSTTVVKLDSGSHDFKIIGYSRSCGIGIGKYIKSQIFAVGGHHWCLRYYPDGSENIDDSANEYVSVFIESVDTSCDVKALFSICLLDSAGGASSPILDNGRPYVFRAPTDTVGFYKFVLKKNLEASNYLRYDSFTIRCTVVVIKELSDIADDLSKTSINEPD